MSRPNGLAIGGLAWLLLALILSATPAGAQEEDPAALTAAMAERLALMAPVAQTKWNAELPIEDLAREAVVLDKVVESAAAAGVDEALARDFFRAQITAAKLVQQRRFDLWRAGGQGRFAEARDLKSDLRPAIIGLTDRIIEALAPLPGVPPAEICDAIADTPQALADDSAAWRAAVQPLAALAGGCPSD